MPLINIGGIIIDFPETAASPVWSDAIIQFALAVEGVLFTLAGPFDVTVQSFSLDPYNTASNVDITNLTFPTSQVRAAIIRYTVHRETDTPNEVDEVGFLWVVWNDLNGTWLISQEKTSNAQIEFNITNTGQVQFSTTPIAGSNHTGFISYAAQALENI